MPPVPHLEPNRVTDAEPPIDTLDAMWVELMRAERLLQRVERGLRRKRLRVVTGGRAAEAPGTGER